MEVDSYSYNHFLTNIDKEIKYPKYTSFGIIPFFVIDNQPYFILIQRKETISFVLFVKNKYEKLRLNPEEEIKKMTFEEKKYLLEMMKWHENKNMPSDLYSNLIKYKDYLLNSINDTHGQLEWFFPKGRKNNSKESCYLTAIREFYEETTFSKCIKEIFIYKPIHCYKYGSDKKKYNYIFYPALIDHTKLPFGLYNNKIISVSSNEVSHIGIFTKEELKQKIDNVIPNLYEKIKKELYIN